MIARFTVQEAVSRRLILAGLLLSVAFLGLFTLGFSLLYGLAQERAASRPNPQLVGVFAAVQTLLGLYAVNFLASLLALFLAAGAISEEIDSGAIHAVLARPIRRAELVLGRWLAYAAMVGVYVGVMAASLLLVARLIAGYEASDPARAVLLMALGSVLLVSVSLCGSTMLPTLTNGVVVFSLFGLAWLAGMVEFIGSAVANETMVNLGVAVSLLVPSDAVWRGASYYIQSPLALAASGAAGIGMPFAANAPPTLQMIAWALAYPLLTLLAAIVAFARRDL